MKKWVLVLALASSVAFGVTKEKSGVAVQTFRGLDGYITDGFMVGFRSVYYIALLSNIGIGWEMMAGTARGGRFDEDNLAYGGISVGYDGTIAKIFFYDLNVLTGFGFGRIESQGVVGHGAFLQPQFSLGLTLIDGYRASFGVGYLYFPQATGLNGLGFTFRLEKKETGSNMGDSH